jgi:DNA-binding MarR family transcriptional regulator
MRGNDEERAAALILELHHHTMRNIHDMRREESAPFRLGQMAVMHILEEKGPCPMSEIGAALGVTKPNITAMTDRLVKDGFAERRVDGEDRRVVRILLSDAGRACLEEKRRSVREHYKKNLSLLKETEVKQLTSALETALSLLRKGKPQ